MRQGSTRIILFYLICYHVNAQLTQDSVWGRSFAGNANLGITRNAMLRTGPDMNGSGSHGTFFAAFKQPSGQVHTETRVEVSNQGMPQGLIDPVNAVNQALSQTSLEMNPMRISTQRFSSDGGHFQRQDTMQTVHTETSRNAGFGSNAPMQTVRRMTSKTIFNPDTMQPIQTVRQTVSRTSMNFDNNIGPSQPIQQVILEQSPSRPDPRNRDRGFTEPNVDRIRERGLTGTSTDRRLFGPAIASIPGAFDLAVTGITVKNSENTRAPKAQTTVSPTLKLVAKEIKEATKGKGIAYTKPLCIRLPDPVYNTLCLMRTEEANRLSNMEIVTDTSGKQTGEVKETFVKASNLVSLIAQGVCAFCCQATGMEQERCIQKFCESNPKC